MFSALLVALILAAGPGKPSAEDVKAYEIEKAKVGRSADDQVNLALWCEARGLSTQRLKHLILATAIDPNHAIARGLLGQVKDDGAWHRPDQVIDRLQGDAEFVATELEYAEKREKARNTADSQWNLALWCVSKGLKDEAHAHFATVIRLDPSRVEAWKRLGYKKVNGFWMTDDQIKSAKAEADAQKRAARAWLPRLQELKAQARDKNEAKRSDAVMELAAVTDPRAVSTIWRVFATPNAADQKLAAQLLGQIDAPAATRALTFLALGTPSSEVRRAATETLARRDPREFVDVLIALIRKPINYSYRPVGGVNAPGELIVEGERDNYRRVYSASFDIVAYGPLNYRNFADWVPIDPVGMTLQRNYGLFGAPFADPAMQSALQQIGQDPSQASKVLANGPNLIANPPKPRATPDQVKATAMVENATNLAIQRDFVLVRRAIMVNDRLRFATSVQQQRLASDVEQIEAYNLDVQSTNEIVLPMLGNVTGLDASTQSELGVDPQAWQKWWAEKQGYMLSNGRNTTRRTFTEFNNFSVAIYFVSCFAANTPVHTRFGLKPIQEVKPGDLVLSQDPETGAVSYQPVFISHMTGTSRTLKLTLDDESIEATGIHRFWKVGAGWVMARELKVGDSVRLLGGTARVNGNDAAGRQKVYNLTVARNSDFFVGKLGALVHDYQIVPPVARAFDAARPAERK